MFMVIMVGATPAMQGVVEEKGQRIAEVLLGSVSPFELMAGKLLGLVGVSLTMAAVYLGGGYVVAQRYGVADMLSPALMAWFVVFLVLALLIYGSLFIAVGAAAGDVKDTQTLLMPVMLVACLPFFALGPIMQDPNGPIAVACSWFPFATPFLLVARQSVPPGVPAVADGGRDRAGPGDDARVRLGGRPHLPRRAAHAREGGEVRRPVPLGAEGLTVLRLSRHSRSDTPQPVL